MDENPPKTTNVTPPVKTLKPKKQHKLRRSTVLVIVLIVMLAAAVTYILVSKFVYKDANITESSAVLNADALKELKIKVGKLMKIDQNAQAFGGIVTADNIDKIKATYPDVKVGDQILVLLNSWAIVYRPSENILVYVYPSVNDMNNSNTTDTNNAGSGTAQ